MATKASNTTAQVMNFEDMDFDALLQQEKELKEKQEQIAAAKKHRADTLKAGAYTEIKEAIKKYFDTVLTREEITTFLHNEEFIMPMVKEAPAGAKVGRRKIADSDILFKDEYTGESGRKMTFKMDELTDKVTGKAGDFYKTLKDVPYADLKKKFTPKFWEFAKKEDGVEWVKQHFPHIAEDVKKEVAPKEEATA